LEKDHALKLVVEFDGNTSELAKAPTEEVVDTGICLTDSLLTAVAIASGVDEGIISLLIDADAVSKHIHSLSGIAQGFYTH
jgi:hypothetical protein